MPTFLRIKGGRAEQVEAHVVRERPLTLYVDGERFVTLLCSPVKLEALVAGYLWMEGLVDGREDIAALELSEADGRADVRLSRPVSLPTERILTSGCGGGITFRIVPGRFEPARSTLRIPPSTLSARLRDLSAAAVHYRASRGIHGAALADADRLLVVAEDVGRHNAVDKIAGEALLRGVPTAGRILLATGRVSSEMLLKASRMGVPLVASRTSPTEMAVTLAEQLGITLVGYLRPDSLNVYAGDAVACDLG
jgi:FdhD protein